MIFRNYPILRLLLPLVLGISIAYWTSLSIAVPWVLLMMLVCCGISFCLTRLKKQSAVLLSGISLQLVFVIAGFELCCLHFPNPDEVKMQEYCQQPSTGIIKEKAARVQHYFSESLAEAGISGSEYSIITAILLGNKETLDTELRAHYNAAGVGHILCVSGLHVGVIFLILNFLLQPLDYSKKSRILKALILLFFIWIYACITGLSPSVTRAATMFSFVTFGNLLRRHTNILHSLFASLFILLIIDELCGGFRHRDFSTEIGGLVDTQKQDFNLFLEPDDRFGGGTVGHLPSVGIYLRFVPQLFPFGQSVGYHPLVCDSGQRGFTADSVIRPLSFHLDGPAADLRNQANEPPHPIYR